MIALIEDSIIDEEFCSKPSQQLLIINRCLLGVFLSLEIPLYLMKPGFICYLFSFDVSVMCGFVQPLNGNLRSFIVPPDFEHRRHGSQRVGQLVLFSWEMFKGDLFKMRQ